MALRAEYGALNTRHLMYLMYKPNMMKPVELKASAKWIYILEMICNGATYNDIAQELSISQSGMVKALEKMKDDNNCFDTDELVILYINWKSSNNNSEADISI